MSTYAHHLPPPNTPPKIYYLLRYNYVDDIMERRGPHREEHLGLATKFLKEGSLVMAGAAGGITTDPPATSIADEGLFVFQSEEAAEKFVENDEYKKNGLVLDHKIKEWVVPVY